MSIVMIRSIVSLLILLEASCSVANFASNKDPNYNASIHSLAVTETGAATDFQDSFNKNLAQLASACGAMTTFSSSFTSAQAEAASKKYDAVLNIELEYLLQPTNWGISVGYPSNFHYVLTLYDPAGNKVWKALMNYDGGLVLGSERRGLVFASEVIKQMNKDNIFTGCMPTD